MPKFAGFPVLTPCAFLTVANAGAQCLDGSRFSVCPAKDVIYLLDEKSLSAISLSERKLIWQVTIPLEATGYAAGPVATEDSVVIYAGVPLTRVYAFDAASGKVSWRIEVSSDEWTSAGPYILYGDREHWEGLNALDGKTGKRVWHHTAGRPGDISFLGDSSKIVLTNIFAIDGYSGQVLKRWPKDSDISDASFVGTNVAVGTQTSPSEAAMLTLYSLPGFQTIWSRPDKSWKKGSQRDKWIAGIDGDAKYILAATYEGDVESPSEATLQAISVASGKTIWSKKYASGFTVATPLVALAQGLAIFARADSRNSGVVEAFDVANGTRKWVVYVDRMLMGSPACSGRYCYFGSLSHDVLAIDIQSAAQSWLALPKE